MKLEHFKFEVEPWSYYGTHGGEEKILRITATVNGKEMVIPKMIPQPSPGISEVSYYAELAIKCLEEELVRSLPTNEVI